MSAARPIKSRLRAARPECSVLPAEPAALAVRMNLIYADALLAPDDLIEDHIRAALDTKVGNRPFERARMQFPLGARLRRQKQIQEAREPLRAALYGFDNLGASLWAGRAREEPRAAGVAVRAQAPAP